MDPVRRTLRAALAHQKPEEIVTTVLGDLLHAGDAYLKDEDWTRAAGEFSNGLDIWQDVREKNIHLHQDLLERLYVGRAAAYHRMGKLDWGIKDCDSALAACTESRQALYRKALCLKDLGRYREAYDCTTASLLVSRLDKHVNELAHELAVHLGLKNPNSTGERTVQQQTEALDVNMNVEDVTLPAPHAENGLNPLRALPPVSFPSMHRGSTPSTAPLSPTAPDSPDAADDFELIGDDLDSLLDSAPNGQDDAEISLPFRMSNSALPLPTPQLPPTFFYPPVSYLDSMPGGSAKAAALDTLDTLDTLDELDDLVDLDDLDDLDDPPYSVSLGALDALDDLDQLDEPSDPTPSVCAVKPLDALDALDGLESFPSAKVLPVPLPAVPVGERAAAGRRSGASSAAQSPRHSQKKSNGQEANPLAATHDFLQACSQCFFSKDRGSESFVHKADLVHGCKQDLLLCRRKTQPPSEWTRVRPIPKWMGFSGPYKLCKDKPRGQCKFGEDCNFAFNQLEIDVWTEERSGRLDRKRLFQSAALKMDPVNNIKHLLQEHSGAYTFLCQECFNSDPRIISERCKDRHAYCSNASARHTFDANKCLVFVGKGPRDEHTKVRSLSVLCQMSMCRNVRHGCLKQDECIFAHSFIELKTWRVQQDTGISHDEIVKLSSKYHASVSQSAQRENKKPPSDDVNKAKGGAGSGAKSLNLKTKFVCAQCWRDGASNEPDKALQHCSGKAKHAWTRDRWLLLVRSSEKSRWVPVRPIPHSKNFPSNYDICHHIVEKKKCSYSPCTFAHSQEEKELWTHMKNTNLLDMQQWYDMWLDSRSRQSDRATATPAPSASEKKNIMMPTDYPELQNAFYCQLCGRHSNGERQWQRHITTEKHKDRVFRCDGEEEALKWSHRFPGRSFELCPKSEDGCSDGVSCDFAHGQEELKEWIARRDFLRQKLAKAREEMLIMPDDFNFGKYNFLLYD